MIKFIRVVYSFVTYNSSFIFCMAAYFVYFSFKFFIVVWKPICKKLFFAMAFNTLLCIGSSIYDVTADAGNGQSVQHSIKAPKMAKSYYFWQTVSKKPNLPNGIPGLKCLIFWQPMLQSIFPLDALVFESTNNKVVK